MSRLLEMALTEGLGRLCNSATPLVKAWILVFGVAEGAGAAIAVFFAPDHRLRWLAIFFGAIAVFCAALSRVMFRQAKQHRQTARRLGGRCGDCGYDMRYSSGRCPECGADCSLTVKSDEAIALAKRIRF